MDKDQINSLKHCIMWLSSSFTVTRFAVLTAILLRIEFFWDVTLCQVSGSQCFKGMQCPCLPRVKQSKKNSQHRESVVKYGYSGNGWWVAGMIVNAEKNPEQLNRLNLLYHLRKSTDWVHVQEFLKVWSDDMMVNFIVVSLARLLIQNTMNLWD